jgi:Mycothiol maleylpyruvate isomerase N-terminal domain
MGDPESAIMELEMVPARSVDCGEIYELKRRELVELLRSLSTDELAITVPATPVWSVRDVLSHVVGIAADLNARRRRR